MKKIISIIILSLGFIAAKAQNQPKILISYDENGNRILRAYVPARPAPPVQSETVSDVPVAGAKEKEAATGKSGMAALTEDNLKVYPNPSNDNFHVEVSEGILKSHAELVLIDQLGREHKREKIRSLTTTISTKGMADGVYSIIVQYGNSRSTTKVVKVTN